MSTSVADRTVSANVHFSTGERGKRRIRHGQKKTIPAKCQGTLPHVTRLMALAIRFEELLAQGTVTDYADLARLGGVSRARITQIMNLRLLAPEIQETLILQERGAHCDDFHRMVDLMGVAGETDWNMQRVKWNELQNQHENANC